MIQNKRQYRITQTKLKEFERLRSIANVLKIDITQAVMQLDAQPRKTGSSV